MQLALYNLLRARIETLTSLKYVRLWNNQFEREDVNVAFGYPCCFIEFAEVSGLDILNGLQQVSMNVNLHLGFESYKTEDTAILQLKQDLNALVHMWSTPNNTKLLRRAEVQNFDHTNIQEYIITYSVMGLDTTVGTLPTTLANVGTLITNNAPQLDDNTIRSGHIPEVTTLTSEADYILTDEAGYELLIDT